MDVIAQTIPLDEDIGDFCGWLQQQGVAHRVSEQGGQQVIWVSSPEHAAIVRELYEQLRRGDLQVTRMAPEGEQGRVADSLAHALQTMPVTLCLIFLSITGAILVAVDRGFDLVVWLTFTDPRYFFTDWPASGQWWRLITPVFLHFGALHICFNALWLWELGRRIEQQHGGARLLTLTLVIGVTSNIAQAQVTGGVIFGGMSGVIYGLLGYCVLWSRFRPEASFHINRGVVIFMLLWLILCFAGLSRLIAGVDTANTAHLSGLITGALGGVFAVMLNVGRSRDT